MLLGLGFTFYGTIVKRVRVPLTEITQDKLISQIIPFAVNYLRYKPSNNPTDPTDPKLAHDES